MRGKRFLLVLLTALLVSGIGTGGWSTPGAALAYDRDVADVSVFYEPLRPHGTWVSEEGHGRVWVPRGVRRGWRPYTDGRWVYTDVGWTWVSDEAWGWAPYHYGRWHQSPRYGWCWVPGTVWGPAWVEWRRSPGWVGWAPLPPRVSFHAGIGLGAAHIGVSISPSWFSFVEERHVLEPRVHRHFAPPSRNVQLVHITKNVTNYTVINKRVVNNSIDVKNVEKVIRRPVVQHRIVEDDTPDRARGPKVRDKEREVVLARPAAVKGRGDDGDRERRARQEESARREQRARQEDTSRREQRNDDRPDISADRERQQNDTERQRVDEQRDRERATRSERQQPQQNQQDGVNAEERRRQDDAARQERANTERRKSQEWRQESAPESPQKDRTKTTEETEYRRKRERRQEHSQEQQESPRLRSSEDEQRRNKRERQQQSRGEPDAERRQFTPTDQENGKMSRDRQRLAPDSQREQLPARARDLTPPERRERREAARAAGQEEERQHSNNKKRKRQSQEEQENVPPGTPPSN